jgi:ribosome recycling factor
MARGEKPVVATYASRMDKAVASLKEEFSSLRTGRASAGLLDQVMVEAYGNTVPLNTVASVSVPDPLSGPRPQPGGRGHEPAYSDPAAD